MTMMHYDNYDGEYGYDLIIIRLYYPFLWGNRAPSHYYHNFIDDDIDDDYDDDNYVDLLYDDDDDVDVNDDYARGSTFGS